MEETAEKQKTLPVADAEGLGTFANASVWAVRAALS